MNEPIRPGKARSLGLLVAAAFAVLTGAAEGQELSSWKLESQQASAAYHDAIEKAEVERQAAQRKAAQTLFKTLEDERTKATRRRDGVGAEALAGRIESERQEGRIPPPRPQGVVSFGGHDYGLIRPGRPWHEAKADCERRGGQLLLLDSDQEEAFILSKWKNVEFWIGATDLYTPGDHVRIDGEAFRSFVAPFHADNYRQQQSAVGWYVPDEDWNDFDDGDRLPYVCEWE